MNSTDNNRQSATRDGAPAPGVFVLDFELATGGTRGIDIEELVEFLDGFEISARHVVMPQDRQYDGAAEAWVARGFFVTRLGAANDHLDPALVHAVQGYGRVFLATSVEGLADWANVLEPDALMVACVNGAAPGLPPALKRRCSAVHYIARMLFCLPPRIAA